MNRRQFLGTASVAAAAAALAACDSAKPTGQAPTPTATLAPSPAPTLSPPPDAETRLLHTLRRITFGPTPAELARARAVGLEAFIEEQLNPETLADDTEDRLAPLATLTMTPRERFELEQRGRPAQELVLAALIRLRYSPRQLYESLADFWRNHFSIYILKNQVRVLLADDERDVIRAHALGRFRDMLAASARSPAMLIYLDNARSTRGRPNENYARELMELHTLGADGGFTQLDVVDVARAFTGWSTGGPRDTDDRQGRFIFRARQHDDGEKFILGRKFPAGQGQAEGEQVLELLAEHPSTARYLAAKLACRFVADTPPESVVASLAETFAATGGDLRATVRALLNSVEFQASVGLKVKRPLEFFVSALRVTDAEVGEPRPLINELRALGQVPYFWQTPDGYPDYAAPWTNTGGLLSRWNFALRLAANQIRGTRVDYGRLVGQTREAEAAVDALSEQFLGRRLPDDAREILAAFAAAGDLRSTLPALAGLILGSPYFQVR